MTKFALMIPLAASFLVAGCMDTRSHSDTMGTGVSDDNCASVPRERLAVPQTSGGMAIVCDPLEINPAYVDEYFEDGRAINPT